MTSGNDKKMFLMYAHKDRQFLDQSLFMSFLRGVAKDEGLELWWDELGSPTLGRRDQAPIGGG